MGFTIVDQKNYKSIGQRPEYADNRGDIGYITKDQMAPSFSDAAFKTKAGSVVGPVKSDFGYHVIKVIDK